MWLESKIFSEDLDYILSYKSIDWTKFQNRTMLVTGGTGLIGYTLISALVYAKFKLKLNMKICAVVRNEDKAKQMFASQINAGMSPEFIVGSVENLPVIDEKIDYIIHGACPTASETFITKPAETISALVAGTLNLMELARKNNVSGFTYLSSMEVYGEVAEEKLIDEDALGYLNPLVVRNCYPEGKRMCEAICKAYAQEYDVNATVVRLAQTFGPGVRYDDARVFAMMARCAINSEDIVLQTKGTKKNSYLYTAQAVTAILTALLNGEKGKAYNAANPDTYCSIFEMGTMVVEEIAKNEIKIRINDNGDVSKYRNSGSLKLDISAIEKIGWTPNGNLKMMYQRMIEMM